MYTVYYIMLYDILSIYYMYYHYCFYHQSFPSSLLPLHCISCVSSAESWPPMTLADLSTVACSRPTMSHPAVKANCQSASLPPFTRTHMWALPPVCAYANTCMPLLSLQAWLQYAVRRNIDYNDIDCDIEPTELFRGV